MLSIIIPCFNHGKYIIEAVDSVKKSRTPYNYEIIIVNDGSTDAYTNSVLQAIDDENITVFTQKNLGLAAARNKAIDISKGKYILPLDSDNKINGIYLTKAIDILESNNSIDVVYGDRILFGDREEVREVGEFRFSEMIQLNYIDACAVYRKKTWEMVQGYDGKMPAMGNEDWEFWIHICLNGGKFCYLNEVCFYYRVLSNSMLVTTTIPGAKLNTEYIYQKHMNKIINTLASDLNKCENTINYIKNYKFKAIAKIILGYKSLSK